MGSKPLSETSKKEIQIQIEELQKQVGMLVRFINEKKAELLLGTEFTATDEEWKKMMAHLQPDITYAKEHHYFDRHSEEKDEQADK